MKAGIGFVGLGVMGAPMSCHLAKAQTPVWVWNRTPGKAARSIEAGAQEAGSLAELAKTCRIIILCVSRSEDVRSICETLLLQLDPGDVVVDHSTIEPHVAKEVAEMLAERGVGFVDAPITGGSMGAENGTLTIFCGGNRAHFEAIEPILSAYGKRVAWVGESGAGQMTKLANQIGVAGALIGLCEALSFASKAGLDIAVTKELLSTGAAGSWAFDFYGPKILNQDWTPGFSIVNQRKDLKYCEQTAQRIDAAIPMSQLVDQLLGLLEQEGNGGLTTAALYDKMRQMGFAE